MRAEISMKRNIIGIFENINFLCRKDIRADISSICQWRGANTLPSMKIFGILLPFVFLGSTRGVCSNTIPAQEICVPKNANYIPQSLIHFKLVLLGVDIARTLYYNARNRQSSGRNEEWLLELKINERQISAPMRNDKGNHGRIQRN